MRALQQPAVYLCLCHGTPLLLTCAGLIGDDRPVVRKVVRTHVGESATVILFVGHSYGYVVLIRPPRRLW